MALSTHDALVTLMIVSAWSDTEMSQQELDRIGLIVTNLPIFAGFDRSRLEAVANKTADAIAAELVARLQARRVATIAAMPAGDRSLRISQLRDELALLDYAPLGVRTAPRRAQLSAELRAFGA